MVEIIYSSRELTKAYFLKIFLDINLIAYERRRIKFVCE